MQTCIFVFSLFSRFSFIWHRIKNNFLDVLVKIAELKVHSGNKNCSCQKVVVLVFFIKKSRRYLLFGSYEIYLLALVK